MSLVMTTAKRPLARAAKAAQSRTSRNAAVVERASTAPPPADLLQRQPACACGGGCPRCREKHQSTTAMPMIQPKLKISPPDDVYEREADRVANQVMRMDVPGKAVESPPARDAEGDRVQRLCSECEQEQEQDEELRRKPVPATASAGDTSPGVAPPMVYEVLHSPGEPLDRNTRAFMEPRFGRDFGRVRVHTDRVAARSAEAVAAHAYTVGSDVVFGSGRYAPTSPDGQRLLAHELAHVVQQGGATTAGSLQSKVGFVEPGLQRKPTSRSTIGPADVPAEKWSELAEDTYRRGGQTRRAEAIKRCRKEGADSCYHVLTEEEARAAYQLMRDGYSPREAASKTSNSHRSTAVLARQATAVALPQVAPLAPAIGAAALAVGKFVVAALPAAAVVAIGALLIADLVEEVRFSRFVNTLELYGFFVLLNPLGCAIGACHRTAPARTSPREFDWPETVPLDPWRSRITPDQLKELERLQQEQAPKPNPEPQPKPTPRVFPNPPTVPDEEEPRRRRCTVEEVAPKFGRHPCHSDFAKTFSGTRREFQVTDPQGIFVTFDAKRGETLFEVKTGYEWMLNPNLGPEMQERRARVLEGFQEQAAWQLMVATRCGYKLDWYFNSKRVAQHLESLVEPPVKWKKYNCKVDSDHTW